MSSTGFTSPFGANANPFGAPRIDVGPMHRVAEEDESENVASPTTHAFGQGPAAEGLTFQHTFGGDAASSQLEHSGPRSPPYLDTYPAQYNFARRTSVSAESLKPTSETYDNWVPPFSPKTPEQLERLKKAISGNFLFKHLEEEQSSQILGALVEKRIPAKGIKVITQGDTGDFFYVVEKGSFDIYVNSKSALQPGPDGMGNKVDTISAGGSFGELALMYNAPRAATVISAEPGCILWVLDRVTFRRILMESTFQRRRMYENFLDTVPLFSTLTPYEKSKIADALESKKYPPGHAIISEGEPGNSFFLLEAGEAVAQKHGVETPVKHYKPGDFFGELALLNDAPRAASIIATTEVKVAMLGKSAFQRLIGPLEGILRRERYVGIKSGVEDTDPLHVPKA
ncbi:cyclic adenosine monophosphate-dependent protein kinase [Rhypophila decipiens]